MQNEEPRDFNEIVSFRGHQRFMWTVFYHNDEMLRAFAECSYFWIWDFWRSLLLAGSRVNHASVLLLSSFASATMEPYRCKIRWLWSMAKNDLLHRISYWPVETETGRLHSKCKKSPRTFYSYRVRVLVLQYADASKRAFRDLKKQSN